MGQVETSLCVITDHWSKTKQKLKSIQHRSVYKQTARMLSKFQDKSYTDNLLNSKAASNNVWRNRFSVRTSSNLRLLCVLIHSQSPNFFQEKSGAEGGHIHSTHTVVPPECCLTQLMTIFNTFTSDCLETIAKKTLVLCNCAEHRNKYANGVSRPMCKKRGPPIYAI